MKKYPAAHGLFAFVIGLCCAASVTAQNLVLNPSFEDISTCPAGISQFQLAIDWYDAAISGCTTPDLYTDCSPSIGGANMPNAVLGYQQAHTGVHHAGFIFYTEREYIEGTLASPLAAGQQYCIRFFANIPDQTSFGTDDIGMYFSPTLVRECPVSTLLPYTPQVNFSTMVSDTADWVQVDGLYTASGGEKYFIIGNFKTNANTTIVSTGGFQPMGYMFVDDVEVTPNVCCPVVTIDTVTGTSCFAGNDGSATVSATGGTPPYTFLWSSGGTGATATSLASGNHRVSVSDANGCIIVKDIAIPRPQEMSVSILSSTTVCGVVNSAVPNGGTTPYSFVWSNGNTGATITALTPGIYSVTALDANNCSATSSTTVTQTSGFAVQTTYTPATCGVCDGLAEVTASGGTPPYSYLWSDSQTTQIASNLCAGVYTVTVTDSPPNTSSVFWSENFTNGSTGWTLNLDGSANNGTKPNLWIVNNNNVECDHCTLGTSGGNYLHITCDQTDGFCSIAGGPSCVYSPGVPIPFPLFGIPTTDKFVASPNISTLGKSGIALKFWYMCDGDSGKDYGLVRLSDNGGATWTDLPKQYFATQTCTYDSILLPANYENIATLKIGFRWINNNDGEGNDPPFLIDDIELISTSVAPCSGAVPVIVSSANGAAVTVDSLSPVSCSNANDGAVDITVTGGTAPYTFLWSDSSANQNISGLSGGTYYVTVTDIGDCISILSVNVEEPAPLSVSGTVTNASCMTSGGVDITVFGGRTPYTYSWSDSSITADITGKSSGNYSVTVTDSSGCTASKTFIISGSTEITLNEISEDVSCHGANNGVAGFTVFGGTAPFQFLWNTGATTSLIDSLPGGSYSITVTDDFNCTVSDTITLDEPNVLAITASITKVLCEGDNEGGIKLNVAGGTTPYEADWSDGSTGLTLNDLPAGLYTATVTDANGCSDDTTLDLSAVSVFQVDLAVIDATCGNATDGSVTVNITDGTTPPYVYSWNTGATTPALTDVAPGAYSVTVTDSLNCLRVDSAVVVEGDLLIQETVTNTTCPYSADGAIEVTVIGGTEPYAYVWDVGFTTSSLLNIPKGIYSLTVTDQSDCSGSKTIAVELDSTGAADCDDIAVYDVFSPNGDGVNDVWVIDGLDAFTGNQLQIFNRWGSVVYEAKPYLNDWKGVSDDGDALATSTYYYILKLNDTNNSVFSGTITLVR